MEEWLRPDKYFLSVDKHICFRFVASDVVGQAICSASMLPKSVYSLIKFSKFMQEAVEEDAFENVGDSSDETDWPVFVDFVWLRYDRYGDHIDRRPCSRQNSLCEGHTEELQEITFDFADSVQHRVAYAILV